MTPIEIVKLISKIEDRIFLDKRSEDMWYSLNPVDEKEFDLAVRIFTRESKKAAMTYLSAVVKFQIKKQISHQREALTALKENLLRDHST